MTKQNFEYLNKSEFYHFGILPRICIHSLIEDEYSKMYVPRQKCECGCCQWVAGKMDIIKESNGHLYPKKDVHRCKECNEVRLSDHIGVVNEE